MIVAFRRRRRLPSIVNRTMEHDIDSEARNERQQGDSHSGHKNLLLSCARAGKYLSGLLGGSQPKLYVVRNSVNRWSHDGSRVALICLHIYASRA